MTINMEAIQIIGNFVLIPIVTLLWSVNTRLSKLEGHLESFQREMKHNHDENVARIAGRNRHGD